MKLEVTELGPNKRALKIEVPADEVEQRFVQAYAELNRQVHVPGFRPGKAPQALLEKRYAKAVEEDLVRRLVPDYYERAVRQAGLVPVVVEVPSLERLKLKRGAPLSFTATVEIKPKIELRDYRPPNPISLKKDTRTVTEEQLTQTLDALREQQAQLHPAPAGHALADGDYALLNVEAFLDLAPLEGTKKEGHLHKVGSKAPVLGLDVDAQLLGKKEGAVVEVSQPYPATHPDQRLAGKTVVFRFTVAGVKQKRLPALDDEFAKDCGPYTTLAELRAKLQAELEQALKRDIEEGYKDQILKRLEETHHFELPESLVDRELSTIVRQTMDRRRRQKVTPLEFEDPAKRQEEIKKIREVGLPEAKRRVKIGLILEAIADREGLAVSPAEMRTEIERMARQVGVSVQELQKIVEAGGEESYHELRSRILAEKALEVVYRQAVVQG